MTLIRLIWISRKWFKGGLHLAINIHWPWDQLCLGHRCEDHSELCGEDEDYVHCYWLHLLLINIGATHVRMTDAYLEKLDKGQQK